MTHFKSWTGDDLDWTLQLWQHDVCRYEWGLELSEYPVEQEEWLQRALMNRQTTPIFVVVYADGDVPVGLAMLDTLDWKNRSARLRMTLLPATLERIDQLLAILNYLIRRAYHQHNLYRLWMVTGEDVPDHHDALNEAGFFAEARREEAIYLDGLYQDEISWSLLRPEWEAALRAT